MSLGGKAQKFEDLRAANSWDQIEYVQKQAVGDHAR